MQSSPVVVPFSTNKVPADFASIQSKVECYQKVTREWLPHLTHMELAILMQIVDRTIGWGQREARFTAIALLNGDKVYGGLSNMMSRATLFRALATLEDRDIIRRRHDAKNGRVVYYSVNMGWTPAVLNVSKRKKAEIEGGVSLTRETTLVSPMRLTKSHPCDTYTIVDTGISTGNHIVSAPPRPAPASSDVVREKMATASAASRAARTTKALTQPQKLAGLEAAWRTAIEDAFPQSGYPLWTIREKAQVKAKLGTWIGKDGPMTEFFAWAATNWAGIIAKQFRWMTKSPAPKVPDITFLLSFMPQFLECRAEGKLADWLASPERTEYEKLTARGLSPEEAAAEIGKSRAVEAMREENQKVQITARARVRQAQIIEKRTLAVATLPVHPESEVARKARAAAAPKPAPFTDVDWATVQPLDPNWEPPE